MGKIFFICSSSSGLSDKNQPDAVVIMKTTRGAAHLAFASLELAEKYIKFLNLTEQCYILSSDELIPEIYFKLNPGSVILFTTTEEVKKFLTDQKQFPYEDFIINYEHPFPSKWA